MNFYQIGTACVIIGILVSCSNRAEQPGMVSEGKPIATTMPINTKEPERKKETVIGTYSTILKDDESARVHNVKLAISKLNEKRIKSGETFSFNETVGPTTKAQGYRRAIIYVNSKRRMGYGGGVCQLSSTLYNAAMEANLQITERHAHNGPQVRYVPPGRDATISFGGYDLKFANEKDEIMIKAYLKEGKLTVEIVGHQ